MAFLKALSKMGLVTLSPEELAESEKKSKKSPEMSMEEIDKLLADDAAAEAAAKTAKPGAKPTAAKPGAPAPTKNSAPAAKTTTTAPAATRPPPAPAAAAAPTAAASPPPLPLQKGGPFDGLYAKAALLASPYPAEKLLRLLDGLQAMDERTRHMAVIAMDAADDSWTIADPVMDAKRKIKVLTDVKGELDASLAAAEQKMKQELNLLEDYEAQAKKTILEKVASLEAQLANELQNVAAQRSNFLALFQHERETTAAEHQRLDGEVARLGVVPRNFEAALRGSTHNT